MTIARYATVCAVKMLQRGGEQRKKQIRVTGILASHTSGNDDDPGTIRPQIICYCHLYYSCQSTDIYDKPTDPAQKCYNVDCLAKKETNESDWDSSKSHQR